MAAVAYHLIESVLIEQPTLTIPAQNLFLQPSHYSKSYNLSVFGLSPNVEGAIRELNDYRIQKLLPLIVVIMVLFLLLFLTGRLVLKKFILTLLLLLSALHLFLLSLPEHLLLSDHCLHLALHFLWVCILFHLKSIYYINGGGRTSEVHEIA